MAVKTFAASVIVEERGKRGLQPVGAERFRGNKRCDLEADPDLRKSELRGRGLVREIALSFLWLSMGSTNRREMLKLGCAGSLVAITSTVPGVVQGEIAEVVPAAVPQ